MKLPNKTIAYKESTLIRLPVILKKVSKKELGVYDLYTEVASSFPEITDFIDTLDCLFALGKIELCEGGIIRYVA